MIYLKKTNDYIQLNESYMDYLEYLHFNKPRIPEHLFGIFTSDWYYNSKDYRCPHDSWIEEIKIIEVKQNSRQSSSIRIIIKLLNAYHDHFIFYVYESVESYQFTLNELSSYGNKAHGDWIVDELILSTDGKLIHEIEFSNGSVFSIKCGDIKIITEKK